MTRGECIRLLQEASKILSKNLHGDPVIKTKDGFIYLAARHRKAIRHTIKYLSEDYDD